MVDRDLLLTRRKVIRQLGLDREQLDLLEELQLVVPVRRAGRERAYSVADVDRLRVYRLLVRDLDVNPAGAEIILRLREQLLAVRQRLEWFLEQANEQGLLVELHAVVDSLLNERF